MKSRTLKFRILTLTIFGALGMAVLGGLGVFAATRLTTELYNVIFETVPVIRSLTLIDMVHDGVRGYAVQAQLGHKEKSKAIIEDAEKGINEHRANVDKEFSTIESKQLSEELKTKLSAAKMNMSKYIESAQSVVASAKNFDDDKVSNLAKSFEEQFEVLEKSLAELGDFAESESQKSFDIKLAFGKNMSAFNMAFSFSLVLFTLIGSWIVAHRVSRRLMLITGNVGESSGSVGAAVNQVVSASQDVMTAVHEQAAAIQQTSSAIEEMSAMMQKTAEGTENVRDKSELTRKLAEDGKLVVENLFQTMTHFQEINQITTKDLRTSNDKIGSINAIITNVADKTRIINDIVFQTKLLSFNASVEAARAGEHGKGFSIVADEVGNLAQMSGKAADEINSLLDSCMTQVSETVDGNRKTVDKIIQSTDELINMGTQVSLQCKDSLENILLAANEVSEKVNEITMATNECAKGVSEIKDAVHGMNSASQLTSRSAEVSIESAKALSGEVSSLRSIASHLSREVLAKSWINKFVWKDDYLLDVDDMDAEHKKLVDLINDFAMALRDSRHDVVIQSFQDLLDYTKYHFSNEEVYLGEIQYPDIRAHKSIHAGLLKKLDQFSDKLKHGQADTDALMNFLNDWLLKHILGVDMKYSRYSKGERTASVVSLNHKQHESDLVN